jgi:hypothetical protein
MGVCDAKKLLCFAVLIVCISFLYFFMVTFVPIPETGEDNAKYITGFLVGTGLTTIIGFYWRRHTDDGDNPPPDAGTKDSTVTTHTETEVKK